MSEWIYGRRTVREHLELLPGSCERFLSAAGAKVDAELTEAARTAGLEVETVPRAKLDALARGGNHQGVCLRVGELPYAELDELVGRATGGACLPLLFVLDSIQDPRNLGAVIRVADGVGAAGIVIPKDRAAGLTASAARSAAGAAAAVPVARVTNLARTLRELKQEGFFVLGAAASDEATGLFETSFAFPLAMVLGAEGAGIRPNVAAQCHALAALPMRGQVASLNVSVAAGIFGYEAYRRHSGKTSPFSP